MPRRDEVYIKTHTRKEGDYVPQAASIIVSIFFMTFMYLDILQVEFT